MLKLEFHFRVEQVQKELSDMREPSTICRPRGRWLTRRRSLLSEWQHGDPRGRRNIVRASPGKCSGCCARFKIKSRTGHTLRWSQCTVRSDCQLQTSSSNLMWGRRWTSSLKYSDENMNSFYYFRSKESIQHSQPQHINRKNGKIWFQMSSIGLDKKLFIKYAA